MPGEAILISRRLLGTIVNAKTDTRTVSPFGVTTLQRQGQGLNINNNASLKR